MYKYPKKKEGDIYCAAAVCRTYIKREYYIIHTRLGYYLCTCINGDRSTTIKISMNFVCISKSYLANPSEWKYTCEEVLPWSLSGFENRIKYILYNIVCTKRRRVIDTIDLSIMLYWYSRAHLYGVQKFEGQRTIILIIL